MVFERRCWSLRSRWSRSRCCGYGNKMRGLRFGAVIKVNADKVTDDGRESIDWRFDGFLSSSCLSGRENLMLKMMLIDDKDEVDYLIVVVGILLVLVYS